MVEKRPIYAMLCCCVVNEWGGAAKVEKISISMNFFFPFAENAFSLSHFYVIRFRFFLPSLLIYPSSLRFFHKEYSVCTTHFKLKWSERKRMEKITLFLFLFMCKDLYPFLQHSSLTLFTHMCVCILYNKSIFAIQQATTTTTMGRIIYKIIFHIDGDVNWVNEYNEECQLYVDSAFFLLVGYSIHTYTHTRWDFRFLVMSVSSCYCCEIDFTSMIFHLSCDNAWHTLRAKRINILLKKEKIPLLLLLLICVYIDLAYLLIDRFVWIFSFHSFTHSLSQPVCDTQ